MKFSWRTEWPLWALLLLLFSMAAVGWMHGPDRVPLQWGTHGEVARYGGKFEGVVLIPIIGLAIYLLFLLLPKIDPAGENYARFAGAYTVLRFTVLLFLTVVYALVHLSMRNRIDMSTLIPNFVGGLFLILGMVLRRLHPNWFVGIRTPWTLTSRRSWTQTHRVGGWVFSVAGLLMILAGILHSAVATLVVIVVIGVGILGTVVYSYFVWRGDPDRIQSTGPFRAG